MELNYIAGHRCTNSRYQVTQMTKFCMVAPNICKSSVWNLLCVTLLGPWVLRKLQILCFLYHALWNYHAILTNQMHFLNCFNSILLVFYMFQTSYDHHQEDYIVHAAFYGMFTKCLCKQSFFFFKCLLLWILWYRDTPGYKSNKMFTFTTLHELCLV